MMRGDRAHPAPNDSRAPAPSCRSGDDIASRRVPCPSTETVLLDDGTLLLLPVRGREQLQVDAPWGRMVHDVVVRGRPVTECVEPDERYVFDATMAHLEDAGMLLQPQRVASPELERHGRQVQWFAQEGLDGPAAQRRIAESTVLVLGVGGFGAAVAELLARAGIGRLVLVDFDRVEESNLPRQLLYGDDDVGVRKAFAAVRRIEEIAAGTEAVPVEEEITCGRDVARLVTEHAPDLFIGGADRPPYAIKRWIDEGAFAEGIPVLHGGSRPPFAYVGPLIVPGVTPCYECFLASRTEPGAEELERVVNELRDAAPPDFPAVGWCDVTAATLATAQAVAVLTGVHEPAVIGREFELDVRSLVTDWMDQLPSQGDIRCERCRID